MESINDRVMHAMMRKKHLLGIVGFLFHANLQFAYCADTNMEYLTSTLPKLCPYSTFCTTGPSKPLRYTRASPCCKPCSCDDDCQMFGNCCPDFHAVRENSPNALPTATCSPPVHHGCDEFMKLLPDYHLDFGVYYHYITSTCPMGYTDQDVINKCINVNKQDLNMKNSVVVSDSRGRAFSNRFCAICNGVQSFTPWDMKLICTTYTEKLIDANNMQNVHTKECIILSSPPTTDIAMKSRCFPVQYDKCNATGRWDIFDSNIESSCASASIPFLKLYPSFEIYKNPYCYLCNTAADHSYINELCPLDGMTKETRTANFVALLNLNNFGHTKVEATNDEKCLPTEIFDYHFGTCRPLNCPVTFLPQNGKCVQVFTQTTSLSIFVLIDAEFADKTTKNLFNSMTQSGQFNKYQPNIQEIVLKIFFDFENKRSSCGASCTIVDPKRNNNGLLFGLMFQTNSRCDITYVIKSLKRWALNETYVSVNSLEVPIAFKLKLLYDSLHHFRARLSTDYLMLFLEFDRFCYSSISFKPLFYCANVDIPLIDYTEIASSNDTNILLSDFTLIESHNLSDPATGNVYRICVDKYLENKNSGVAINVHTMVIAYLAVFGMLFQSMFTPW